MRRYILVNLVALFVLFNAVVLIASVTKAKVDGRRGNCHIMSLHNLSLMYKGFFSFAQDNGERLPWQLTLGGVRKHIDAGATVQERFGMQVNGNVNLVRMHPRVAAVGGSVGIRAIKRELGTAKVLLSPCDASRKKANELIDKYWRTYDTRAGRPVPHSGMSYGICFGADTMRPSTVFAASRNLTTRDLSTAKWAGENSARIAELERLIASMKEFATRARFTPEGLRQHKAKIAALEKELAELKGGGNAARGIRGLKAGQGYLVLMDGATSLSTDADLGLSGKVIRNHFRATGGVAKGRSSTLMALPYGRPKQAKGPLPLPKGSRGNTGPRAVAIRGGELNEGARALEKMAKEPELAGSRKNTDTHAASKLYGALVAGTGGAEDMKQLAKEAKAQGSQYEKLAKKAEAQDNEEEAAELSELAAGYYHNAGIFSQLAEMKRQGAENRGKMDWTKYRALLSQLGSGVPSQPSGDDDGLVRIGEIEQEIADLTAQLREFEAELSKVRRMKAREPKPFNK